MHKRLKWLATVTLAIAAPAAAGEITGNGDPTPVNSHRAASICSFSGLNDDGAGPNTHVQNWGVLVHSFGGAGQVPFDGPGIECRGH